MTAARISLRLLVVSIGLLSATTALAQNLEPGVPRDTILWSNPAGGAWEEASNWTPANVPDAPNEYPRFKRLAGDYVVTLNSSFTIGGCRIDSGGPGLDVIGATLVVAGHPQNWGTLRLSDGATFRAFYGFMESRGGRIIAGPGGGSVTTETIHAGSFGMIDFTHNGPYGVNWGRGSLESDGGDLSISCSTILNGDILRPGGTDAVRILWAVPQGIVVFPGAELEVAGRMEVNADGHAWTNNGTISIPATGTLKMCIFSNNTVTVNGTGEIILNGGVLESGGLIVNGFGHTIRGCGTILGNIQNNGTIESDCTGSETSMIGQLYNMGKLRIPSGTFKINGAVFSYGQVSVLGGRLRIEQPTTLTTDLGSRFSINAGTVENLGSMTIRDLAVGTTGTLHTRGGAMTSLAGEQMTTQGTVRIDAQGTVAVGPSTEYVQTGGATILGGGALNATRDIQIQGGALRGIGTVAADVVSAGEVSPSAAAGSLTIQGDYHQLASGSLEVGLAGMAPGQYSRLVVTGTATLDGPVEVATVGGFSPSSGVPFEVLSYGSVTGQFSEVGGTGSLGGVTVVPHYDADGLDLTITGLVGVEGPGLPVALRFYGSRDAGQASFVLDLPTEAVVTVRAYDVRGREVATLADGTRPAGVHRFALAGATRTLPSGVYFARALVQGGGSSETRTARIVVSH